MLINHRIKVEEENFLEKIKEQLKKKLIEIDPEKRDKYLNNIIENRAKKIQRYYDNSVIKSRLNGKSNHTAYKKILSLASKENPLTHLAELMYGRVIATPNSFFPGLGEKNPHIGNPEARYHRSDKDGNQLIEFILKKWNIDIDPEYVYVPVTTLDYGMLELGLESLKWEEGVDFEFISAPDTPAIIKNPLKFLKISKYRTIKPQEDPFVGHPWMKISSLGSVASVWCLSSSAVHYGYEADLGEKTNDPILIRALKRQATSMKQFKESDVVKKLRLLKNKHDNVVSSLEKQDEGILINCLFNMISKLPDDIEEPDCIARLSLFLDIAIHDHNHDHEYLGWYLFPIVHEISLLLFSKMQKEINQSHDCKPEYIEFKTAAFKEFKKNLNLSDELTINQTQDDVNQDEDENDTDFTFIKFATNCGQLGSMIANHISMDCQTSSNPQTVQQIGKEYWEVDDDKNRTYTLRNQIVSKNGSIIRFNLGANGDSKKTYSGIHLNEFIKQEILAKKNKKIKFIIVDNTSAPLSFELTPEVINTLKEYKISLFFWGSGQKFNLLHTDQAQIGDFYGIYHRDSINFRQICALETRALEFITHSLDARIAMFIEQNCRDYLDLIRERHFKNGKFLRQTLPLPNGTKGVIVVSKDKKISIGTESQIYKDPFVNLLSGGFSDESIEEVRKFLPNRDSFGHVKTTMTDNTPRISAGTENQTNISILAEAITLFSSKKFEEIYDAIVRESNKFSCETQPFQDFSDTELIHFLALMQALSHYEKLNEFILPLSVSLALRSFIQHSKSMKTDLFNCHRTQYVKDIYQFFKISSPFKSLLNKLKSHNFNDDANIILLLTVMDERYVKTGIIDLEDAIKKIFPENHSPEMIVEYKCKLFSNPDVSLFFSEKLKLKEENKETLKIRKVS